MKTLFRILLASLPARWAIRAEFLYHQRAFPSLRRPRTFSEWIQFRKLYDHNPEFVRLADKIEVKSFVSDAVGSQIVTPTLWSGGALPPVNERRWPLPYVLKASHGSGRNLFVHSREDEQWGQIEAVAEQWLRCNHASFAGEWLYTQIQPRILVEPYLGQVAVLPLDYKFFVFGGRVEYVQVDTDRATNHHRCFFDRDWNLQSFGLAYPIETRPIPKPGCFDDMLRAAECLGKTFDFVRVDLYEIDGRPRFGEMTFYPGSGLEVFSPKDYDLRLGQLWTAAVLSRENNRP